MLRYSRLNRNQLLAPAVIVLRRSGANEQDDICDKADENPKPGTKSTRSRKKVTNLGANQIRTVSQVASHSSTNQSSVTTKRLCKWVKQDLPLHEEEWSPILRRTVLLLSADSDPIEFFKLLL